MIPLYYRIINDMMIMLLLLLIDMVFFISIILLYFAMTYHLVNEFLGLTVKTLVLRDGLTDSIINITLKLVDRYFIKV